MDESDHASSPLSDLNSRLAVIRDRVRGVANGHHTGFYLCGRAGTCKTHTVRTTLDDLEVKYEYLDGHVTPMGLFDLLSDFHDRTIVLDDVSQIFGDKKALQLLLAALGNQPDDRHSRIIKYRRQGHDETIHFTGGIIAISNLELHSQPLLEALKSRVHYLKYAPTDEQIAALMMEIAKKGWPGNNPKLTSNDCMDVATFLIEQSQRLNVRFDMRMLVDKAFPDFLQHRQGDTEAHWKDLILASLEEQTVDLIHTKAETETRQASKLQEQQIIRDLMLTFTERDERLAEWVARTGKSERAFYRRLKEIGS